MSKRIVISSGSEWEPAVGYSRLIRIGNLIEIAGTTAIDGKGRVISPGNPYEQTVFILQKMDEYLKQVGASPADVTRTRLYVTNIEHWEVIGKAHRAFFGQIKPVATMVEVRRLIHPQLMVKIEATAYCA